MGFFLKKPYPEAYRELFLATQALSHRGPDGSGIFLDQEKGIGLGHTRLSIIDLSPLGRQPMSSEDESVWIVFNGEIYNFLELREYLSKKGLSFRSRSDTEVLLKAYSYWGTDLFEHIQGMFAFAIWDARKKLILLGRDRVGKKPLYYTVSDKGLFFGSELKALIQFRGLRRQLDLDSLALYLHYQYIPSPNTIYQGFKKLEPGHYLVYHEGTPRKERYWTTPTWPQKPDSGTDIRSGTEQLKSILLQAVKARLISDVPVGCLLSGGNDSSLIAALAQEITGGNTRTFTISFEDKEYDEGPYAREVAKILKTHHTEMTLSPKEALEIIRSIPYIYDEPFGDSSGIPTYLVSKLARSHVKVVITGDGGDEQFGGYVRYWAVDSMLRIQRKLKPVLITASYLSKLIPEDFVVRFYDLIKDYLPERFRLANMKDKYQKLVSILLVEDIEAIYRLTIGIFHKDVVPTLIGRDVPRSKFEDVISINNHLLPILKLMYVDQNTYLPECMLTKVDRASMFVGLEVRCPLLDIRVFEFTRRLSLDHFYRYNTGKWILKELLRNYIPDNLVERPKTGFGIPLETWFRQDLREMLMDYLSFERIKKEGIFNPVEVERYVREHLSGEANHQHRLWLLLVWELWKEAWG